MISIFERFTVDDIKGYITERAATTEDPYLGQYLFPNKRTVGLDLAWLSKRTGVGIALRPSAFDVKAELRDRIGIGMTSTRLAFFKEAMVIGEELRQKLISAKEEFVQPLINEIYNDIYSLTQGAEVSAERMRMQLLAYGTINVSVDGAAYSYDYQFPPTHKATISDVTKKWSATATADPLSDIEGWLDTVEADGGGRPTRAICSPTVWGYLRKNAVILKAMNPVTYATARMTPAQISEFIYEQVGLTVEVNRKTYKVSQDAPATAYFPSDVFTILPTGDLGNTYYGTTPEEADLLSGNNAASVRVLDNGVAITVANETDPVNVSTKVSAVMLPSLERMNEMFIADVA